MPGTTPFCESEMNIWRVLLRPLLLSLLVAAATIGVAPARAQAAPAYSLEERALAMASPSLVYVEIIFTGYLRDKSTNAPLRAAPITFNRRCSGFVVDPSGYVLTNGLCVKPAKDTAARNALYSLGRILITEKALDPDRLDAYVADNLRKTVFTGIDPASEPESQVYGQLNVATGNVTDSPAIPGETVRVLAADAGNLALVKLAQEDLPAVELNTSATLSQGSSLLAIGYATGEVDPRTATYTLESKSVKITGVGSRGAVSVHRINDDVGIYSHGGMAIDTSGRVVGVLDNDEALADKANRALVQMAAITALLGEAGVTNTLGDTDRLYRNGLDAYFAGEYSEAIRQLGTVATNAPTNLVAQTYRQNAVDRQRIEGEASALPNWVAWLLAALGGALVVGIVTVVALLLRRRARRRTEAAVLVSPYAAYPSSPVSGAPISGAPTSGGYPNPAYPMPPTQAYYAPPPLAPPPNPDPAPEPAETGLAEDDGLWFETTQTVPQPAPQPTPGQATPVEPTTGAPHGAATESGPPVIWPSDEIWPNDEPLPDEVAGELTPPRDGSSSPHPS